MTSMAFEKVHYPDICFIVIFYKKYCLNGTTIKTIVTSCIFACCFIRLYRCTANTHNNILSELIFCVGRCKNLV